MTDTVLHDAIRRGAEADDLLGDPAFSLALADLGNAIVNQWASSDLGDAAKRESLYHQYTALTLVTQQLAQRVAGGRVAQERLKEDHELALLDEEYRTSPQSQDWDDPNDWDLD